MSDEGSDPGSEQRTPSEPVVMDLPPITLNSMPKRAESTILREEAEEGDKYLIYEGQLERIYLLTDTAKKILEYCDGANTVQGIVDRLVSDYEVPTGVDVPAAVLEYVDVLRRAHVVEVSQ